MKKLFMLMAFVAMFITASAQDAGMKWYADADMSFQIPEDFNVKDSDDDSFFAKGADDFGEIFAMLTTYATEMSVDYMNEHMLMDKNNAELDGWKCEDPVIKGNVITMRSLGEEEADDAKVKAVKMYFRVKSGKKHLSGYIMFKQDEEAKMKPLFEKMLTSIEIN